jgi:hypothetical protein
LFLKRTHEEAKLSGLLQDTLTYQPRDLKTIDPLFLSLYFETADSIYSSPIFSSSSRPNCTMVGLPGRRHDIQHDGTEHQVTAINFILPLNLKFKCEFEFTKYSRGTKYLCVIHQTSQIQISMNRILSNFTEYEQIFAKG